MSRRIHWELTAERLARRALERLTPSGQVLSGEYPLDLRERWGWGQEPARAVEAILARQRSDYEQFVSDICEMIGWARTIPRHQQSAADPCWENDYWGGPDALAQCAALKRRDPELYLEVGSGYSTLFARRAIADFGLRTRIISVDPAPRAEVRAACDEAYRVGLQDLDLSLFDRLRPGDVILFDGSHVALMNSDATIFFLEVLPRVAPGVLVGVDDVFLPWDYPPDWATRLYGEQYLVAAHLLGGGAGWQLRFPGWWVVECSPLADRFEPLWPTIENRFGRHAGSFWFERI